MHQRKKTKERSFLGKCSSQKVAECTSSTHTHSTHTNRCTTTPHHLPYPPSTVVSLTRSCCSSRRYSLYLRWSSVQRVSSLFTCRSYINFRNLARHFRNSARHKTLPGPSGRLADVDSFLLFDRRANDGIYRLLYRILDVLPYAQSSTTVPTVPKLPYLEHSSSGQMVHKGPTAGACRVGGRRGCSSSHSIAILRNGRYRRLLEDGRRLGESLLLLRRVLQRRPRMRH